MDPSHKYTDGMDDLVERWDELVEPHHDVKAVRDDMRVAEIVEIFRKYHFLSFPVTRNEDGHDITIGLVDLLDITAFVIQTADSAANDKFTFSTAFNQTMMDTKVFDIMNFSKMDNYAPLRSKATFEQVLETLSKPGVHRVPLLHKKGIINKYDKVHRFVTQSEIVRFLSSHLDNFDTIFNKTVAEAGVTKPGVVTFKESDTAFDAFAQLVDKGISAAPVLGKDGKIVDCISVKDIRSIFTDRPDIELKSTLGDFLKNIRDEEVPKQVLTAGQGDLLRHCVSLLNSNRIHRLFIVDGSGYPISVLSLKDLFEYILSNPHPLTRKEKKEKIIEARENEIKDAIAAKHGE